MSARSESAPVEIAARPVVPALPSGELQNCEIKRLLELRAGDPEFRAALTTPGTEIARQWKDRVRPALAGYRHWIEARCDRRARFLNKAGRSKPTYAGWRSRQVCRLHTQGRSRAWMGGSHIPFSVELTSGCSVGCPHCAFAPGPLRAVARFNSENEKLFGEILDLMADFFGEGAETASLYMATEPLDNPHYERYLRAFYDRFGVTPSTTMSAWYRNIGRTRKLLEQSARDNGGFDRLTINSLELLHRCMESFSAKELERVGLVQVHPESATPLCASGRGGEADARAESGTIGCLTGFAVNLPEKTVTLMSPCTDLERWPLGYAVYRRGRFETAADLSRFVMECDSEVFARHFDDVTVPRFRDDLTIAGAGSDGAFTLASERGQLSYETEIEKAVLEAVDGRRCVEAIVTRLTPEHEPVRVYYALERLYAEALFEHLPTPRGDDSS